MKKIASVLLLCACGATQVKVEPVKIEPIHITVDVNVRDKQATPTGDVTQVGSAER